MRQDDEDDELEDDDDVDEAAGDEAEEDEVWSRFDRTQPAVLARLLLLAFTGTSFGVGETGFTAAVAVGTTPAIGGYSEYVSSMMRDTHSNSAASSAPCKIIFFPSFKPSKTSKQLKKL